MENEFVNGAEANSAEIENREQRPESNQTPDSSSTSNNYEASSIMKNRKSFTLIKLRLSKHLEALEDGEIPDSQESLEEGEVPTTQDTIEEGELPRTQQSIEEGEITSTQRSNAEEDEEMQCSPCVSEEDEYDDSGAVSTSFLNATAYFVGTKSPKFTSEVPDSSLSETTSQEGIQMPEPMSSEIEAPLQSHADILSQETVVFEYPHSYTEQVTTQESPQPDEPQKMFARSTQSSNKSFESMEELTISENTQEPNSAQPSQESSEFLSPSTDAANFLQSLITTSTSHPQTDLQSLEAFKSLTLSEPEAMSCDTILELPKLLLSEEMPSTSTSNPPKNKLLSQVCDEVENLTPDFGATQPYVALRKNPKYKTTKKKSVLSKPYNVDVSQIALKLCDLSKVQTCNYNLHYIYGKYFRQVEFFGIVVPIRRQEKNKIGIYRLIDDTGSVTVHFEHEPEHIVEMKKKFDRIDAVISAIEKTDKEYAGHLKVLHDATKAQVDARSEYFEAGTKVFVVGSPFYFKNDDVIQLRAEKMVRFTGKDNSFEINFYNYLGSLYKYEYKKR